mgnify:CR=1 FL=1
MRKILFVDRDGTLVEEPHDEQVDQLDKIKLKQDVIPSLLRCIDAGYELVMVTNQDGLGTEAFPQADFDLAHQFILDIFSSQGIHFSDVLICPHTPAERCDCRKPKLGLVTQYLTARDIDFSHCYVIGDRDSDMELAKAMHISGFDLRFMGWKRICDAILLQPRVATFSRKTHETDIQCQVNLDQAAPIDISTGIGFFDHMLEQFAKHSQTSVALNAIGDLHIDTHHTVEDAALTLGTSLRQALGDKRGIDRYGFTVVMDEARADIAIDLSGRSFAKVEAGFKGVQVGELPTEMIVHFFHSLADAMQACVHITATGDNDHHIAEAMFKGFARAFKLAKEVSGAELPTTKGVL